MFPTQNASPDTNRNTLAHTQFVVPPLTIDVLCQQADWYAAPFEKTLPEKLAQAICRAFLAAGESKPHEVSLVLSDDAQSQQLNRDWRGQGEPTNVLSFPARNEMGEASEGSAARGEASDISAAQDQPALLGDIVIARETVLREAVVADKNPSDHLVHLVIHGLLHLLGYDHIDDGMAEKMETLEVAILAELGISSPYAEH